MNESDAPVHLGASAAPGLRGADVSSEQESPLAADEIHPRALAADHRRRPVAGQHRQLVLEPAQAIDEGAHRARIMPRFRLVFARPQ